MDIGQGNRDSREIREMHSECDKPIGARLDKIKAWIRDYLNYIAADNIFYYTN